jgi:hypothetical protein
MSFWTELELVCTDHSYVRLPTEFSYPSHRSARQLTNHVSLHLQPPEARRYGIADGHDRLRLQATPGEQRPCTKYTLSGWVLEEGYRAPRWPQKGRATKRPIPPKYAEF